VQHCGISREAARLERTSAWDVILAGGGLANGLIAMRLRQLRPELRLLVLERGPALGGNHTWSFHTTDLGPGEMEWIRPLVSRSWPCHRVLFPRYERTLPGGYHSVRSERFHEVLARELGDAVRVGTPIAELAPGRVTLADGTELAASCVIDGRGFPSEAPLRLGYQKFFGIDLTLAEPHGLEAPILMDARCPQIGGYRFFYVLPWSEREMLVEDTYYSDTPELDAERLRAGVLRYAGEHGWSVVAVGREETGVLPVPLEGRAEAFLDAAPRDVPRAGVRAGLFHLTTSYSLPWAVRLADAVAALPRVDSGAVLALVRDSAVEHWRQGRFFRLLNRMLFQAARPEQRVRVFQKFYRAPASVIERFYAGRLTWPDRVRILSGRPPVPVLKALRSAWTSA
jgi:lycopene beta-cyclase